MAPQSRRAAAAFFSALSHVLGTISRPSRSLHLALGEPLNSLRTLETYGAKLTDIARSHAGALSSWALPFAVPLSMVSLARISGLVSNILGLGCGPRSAGPVRQERTCVRLTDRSQIKLMYGSHHQQPQKHGRNDEFEPFLVVREPWMHAIHGQPLSGSMLHRTRHMIKSNG
jgi:hypothetical protein